MLILDVNYKGIDVNAAQAAVGVLTISDDHKGMTFAVNFRANADSEIFMTNYYSCDYSELGGDPIKQAYDYIKQLDVFSEALIS